MFCMNCGSEIPEGSGTCPSCGSVSSYSSGNGYDNNANNQYNNNQYNNNQYNNNQAYNNNYNNNYNNGNYNNSPNNGYNNNAPYVSGAVDPRYDYTPISMWGYLGYQILFSIPLIGFIFLLVYSFGGTKNINVRNFARSYFCVLIILVILTIIMTSLGVFAGIMSSGTHHIYH